MTQIDDDQIYHTATDSIDVDSCCQLYVPNKPCYLISAKAE